jgi:tetratricopeptide (TPR) repeat protein
MMLVEKVPYLLLSILFGIIAIFGKTTQLQSFPLWKTCLVMVKAIMFTIGKWILPIHLSVLYPFYESVTITSPAFALPILGLFGLLALLGFFSFRYRTLYPLLCAALFLLPLLPSLLNFSKGGLIYITSDRYAYLPSLGMLLGIMLVMERLFRMKERSTVTGMILVIFTATALAQTQTKVWAGSEPLFRNVLRSYPESHIAHNNLANFLSEKARAEGNIDTAIEEYKRALETNGMMQKSFERDNAQSKILSNMASAYRQSGDISSARKYYEEALRMNAINPYALVGLGIIAGIEGNRTESERIYISAITTAPRFSPAYLNLGSLYASIGKYPEALAAFDTAIEIDPFLPQAHFNRGVILQKVGRLADALNAYRTAVNLAPHFVAARINLGILEANRGNTDEAIRQFESILQIDPQNRKAKEALEQLQ